MKNRVFEGSSLVCRNLNVFKVSDWLIRDFYKDFRVQFWVLGTSDWLVSVSAGLQYDTQIFDFTTEYSTIT